MMQGLRILASGVAFLIFGLVGFLVCFVVMPLLYVLPGDRKHNARRVIQKSFGGFMNVLMVFRLIDAHDATHGAFVHDQPCIYICNHPTLIDVVFLISQIPGVVCVVKEGVWNNPCMALAVRTAGYLPNRSPEQIIDHCTENIIEGGSVLVFPEGTRSLPQGVREFKRGAARIAINAGCQIVPLFLTCTPPTLAKGQAWYHMADQCCDLKLEGGEPLDLGSFGIAGLEASRSSRVVTERIQSIYEDWLANYFTRMKNNERT